MVEFPEDTEVPFEKIVGSNDKYYAIDAKKDLWFWGDEFVEGLLENTEDLDAEKPHKVSWFREQGLNVVDVQASQKAVIVKTTDDSGEVSFFGIPRRYTANERFEISNDFKLGKFEKKANDMIGFGTHD